MKEIIVRAAFAIICIAAIIFVPYYSGLCICHFFPSIDVSKPPYWLIGMSIDLGLIIAIAAIIALVTWIITGDGF